MRRLLVAILLIPAAGVMAQNYDPAPIQAAQRTAMERLARMDGVWEGTAWTLTPTGERHELTQTERVGLMLGGTLRVIEGRGYEADGALGFNAFGIVSFTPATGEYAFRAYSTGSQGDFPFSVTDDGFEWSIEVGPVRMNYTATITGDSWHEVGYRSFQGGDAVQFFEMTLSRVGNTDWPAGNPVMPGN